MALPDLETTPIPGLVVIRLDVRADNRGWFKENWQREKMTALGLPDFGPVQQNISYNAVTGTTRGLHAEPWDKLVSVAAGKVFGAWVDLRAGESFGASFHCELDEAVAVFVPRGVANGFQTLADGTAYSYLVNDHWRADARDFYSYVNLADPTAAIPWPIPLDAAVLSDADRTHPNLAEAKPVPARQPLILGADGQLGRALQAEFGDAVAVGRAQLDLADPDALEAWPWQDHDVVINAAAYTKVDEAETEQGRRTAWQVNASAVAQLARLAVRHGFTLVHVSSDYVFDGTEPVHTEDEPFSPLGVYGQSKAAGDLAVSVVPRHYLIRTSWVIGDGPNFVATMEKLAADGVKPTVVDDQWGRLTPTATLASGIAHLLDNAAPYGTYNLTSDGEAMSWAEIARQVFVRADRSPEDVTPIPTATWAEQQRASGKETAPRPRHSVLDLAKLHGAGFRSAQGTSDG